MSGTVGHVWLVGAGPGDPRLITVAGLEALREAEVVVYDRLAAIELIAEAPQTAIRVDAGKQPGSHTLTQDAITSLLIEHGLAGRRVVRLKGGDPFVFGRGGEEALALASAGVPCTVIPGVSSVVAGPEAAGIPLTHRGTAASFAVLTGETEGGQATEGKRWRKLAAAADTVVVVMGTRRLERVVRAVIDSGRDPRTPAAVIERATTALQRVIRAPLEEIVATAVSQSVQPPALLVVGDTVGLEQCLSPRRLNPLAGRRVLVTRPEDRAGGLARLLAIEGAVPLQLPLLRIESVDAPARVAAAVDRLRAGAYGWVAFTSVTAVEQWFARLQAMGLDSRAFADTSVCAVGPATRDALERRGIVADLVPQKATGRAAAAALVEAGVFGARILLPRPASADRSLSRVLVTAGATVDHLPLYRTLPIKDATSALDGVAPGGIDLVTLASPSAARSWASLVAGGGHQLRDVPVACLGPTTHAVAKSVGLTAAVTASDHNIGGMVAALRAYFSARASGGID